MSAQQPPAGGTIQVADLGAVITATAATASADSGDLVNTGYRGVKVVYDVTAVVSTGSFTVKIEGKDQASGKYYTLLTGAATTATGTTVYTVYPGIAVTSNVSASDVLPKVFRVTATYNSGTSQTFTVGVTMLP